MKVLLFSRIHTRNLQTNSRQTITFFLRFKRNGKNTTCCGDNYHACYLVRQLILKTWIESDTAKMANKKHFIEYAIKEKTRDGHSAAET